MEGSCPIPARNHVDDDDSVITGMVASGSTFWHFGHRLAAEPFLNKLRKEIGEWHDVLSYACLFQSGHVRVPPFERHHCPRVSTSREHHVHEKPADTAVAIHIRMDIDEDKMPEQNPYWRLGLLAEHLEKHRHGIANGIAPGWNVH